jgi:hypothetical protein
VTPGYLTIVGRTGVWPDYDRRDLWAAVQTYVDRERRYGAVDAPKASGIGDAAPPRGADLWERLPIRSSWAYSRPNRTTTGEGSVRMGPSMGAARWDEHSAR